MSYPEPTKVLVDDFQRDGFFVVEDAVDPSDLEDLVSICDQILADKAAFKVRDWAWKEGSPQERKFAMVQTSPTHFFPRLRESRFRQWAGAFATALMGAPMEFWYDQFLGKPPGFGAATPWHQDEGYWGRALFDKGITCWMPFHDVDIQNGCMHFIRGGHKLGVLTHRQPEGIKSDLLTCEVDERDIVACPIRLGGVTFHHSKMPHMTPANQTQTWRKVLAQHFKHPGVPGEGEHYSWKVWVDQITGDKRRAVER
jgi:ectoine hydroxylase-related dioxygenase (phytanoyl-CoA dioxygenase family)